MPITRTWQRDLDHEEQDPQVFVNRYLTDPELNARGFRLITGYVDTEAKYTIWQRRGVVLVRDQNQNSRIVSAAIVNYKESK